MKKQKLVAALLADVNHFSKSFNKKDLLGKKGVAFAPSNIALCKYWGKKDEELNIPYTNSLSISLGNKGALTQVEVIDANEDKIELNNKPVLKNNVFYQRLVEYLNLFREQNETLKSLKFSVKTKVNIPVAAGVASSACGFAAIVLALNNLFEWKLTEENLSVLARIGSGSASRSIWHGFVEWHSCISNITCDIGLNSFAKKLDVIWPELRVGLLLIDSSKKKISSKDAMRLSVNTSPFYKIWPDEVENAIKLTKEALAEKDFVKLGTVAEQNSIAMHAVMHTTKPAIVYANSKTIEVMHKIWLLRNTEKINVFFTQDAGPNLKLIFLEEDTDKIVANFQGIEVIEPFSKSSISS